MPYRIVKYIFTADLNYILSYISAVLGLEKSLGHPVLLTLEPANVCDQKCTVCETGQGILGRKAQMMSFEEFKYILDQFDSNLKVLYLYFMGETFLNKDAYKMIRYAADRGLYVSVCTNGNSLIPEKLIETGIADIWFQIAGITQEDHEKYRRGGDLQKVKDNIRKLLSLRDTKRDKIKKEKYPMHIGMGYILMKYNEGKVNGFLDLAKELKVDTYHVIPTCARNIEQAREYLPSDKNLWYYDRAELEKGRLAPRNIPHNYCEWIYFTTTIQVSGDVVPCCRDPLGQYVLGNVFEENIYQIWNNDKYRKLRHRVTIAQNLLQLCNLCEGYSIPKIYK